MLPRFLLNIQWCAIEARHLQKRKDLLLILTTFQGFLEQKIYYLKAFIKAIEKRISEATGEIRSTSFLFQQISIAICHGNSSCVIGTVPHTEGLDEVFECL